LLPHPIKTSLIILLLLGANSIDASVVIPENNRDLINPTQSIEFLADKTGNLGIEEIQRSNQWQLWQDSNILNFGMTQSAYWVKIDVRNLASEQYLRLKAPLIDYIDIYFITDNRAIDHRQTGAACPFEQREVQSLNYLFKIPKGKSTAYIHLRSHFALQVPVEVAPLIYFSQADIQEHWALGLYFGLMLVMIFYNLFIYFSVRDKTYLFYIFYIAFITLTYASFKGIAFQYLWPNQANFNNLVPAFASMAGMFIFLFGSYFLGIRKNKSPRLYWLGMMHIMFLAMCSLANILGDYYISANISQLVTTTGSFYLLFISISAYRSGIKTARFFLLAWSLYLISVIIYILQLQNIIAYSVFNNNAVLYGSAIEAVLISFALADRINILKVEKEQSQQQVLQALQEKERLISKQNITLEKSVKARTQELDQANHRLQQTLGELKQAQSKMVESEKMTSLGQLTAGIAHEMNNPLTFIRANIQPLKRNISTLNKVTQQYGKIASDADWETELTSIATFKQQVDYEYTLEETQLLLDGIEEGANRTLTIVEGLKSFSRLDNCDFQDYKLEQGIESTLTLLRHRFQDHDITLNKDYGKDISIPCLPDRLNQVFMNILSNAIDALKEKKEQGQTDDNHEISIVLQDDDEWVSIQISDNGIGINQEHRDKIFEPFFTTKKVGSGTGLGLSIVYGIIQDHKGEINIESTINEKTLVTIRLPK